MGLMDKKGTEGRSRSFMRVLLKEGEDTEKLKRKSDRNEKKRKERGRDELLRGDRRRLKGEGRGEEGGGKEV